MINRNVAKGVFLMAIALLFGGVALRYNLGELQRSGPGMFPFLVSVFLFLIGLLMVVRARFIAPVPLSYNVKNIVVILAAFAGFALISEHVNMIAAIVYLVFCSTLAGTSYSVPRNVVMSLGLIAIAFGFKEFLGLQLPLY